jgi:hypothetical protein
MKISIFWDITPYSPLKISRHFGGASLLPVSGWFLLGVFFDPVHRRCLSASTGLHDVICQKIELFLSGVSDVFM